MRGRSVVDGRSTATSSGIDENDVSSRLSGRVLLQFLQELCDHHDPRVENGRADVLEKYLGVFVVNNWVYESKVEMWKDMKNPAIMKAGEQRCTEHAAPHVVVRVEVEAGLDLEKAAKRRVNRQKKAERRRAKMKERPE
uniref:Uncharacterized protein n=1 Tax=Pristionchus pacificus TaxID=54126 RepID=A0A2A6B4Z8_PRIPA|eukprot:PDM60965.1 hypothetical protein PRIPAC_54771 [Pristionchus pacificus]